MIPLSRIYEYADKIYLPNETLEYDDSDAIPFFYIDNDIHIGNKEQAHETLLHMMAIKKSLTDGKDQGEIYKELSSKMKLKGRVWLNHKIISFWDDISKETLSDILVDLKDKLNIDFNDWVIDIGTENEKTKLVQIGEYKFKMRDEKDQEIRHLMDVNKKTKIKPIGFGSDKKNTPLSYRQRVRQETLGFDKYFNKLNESNDNDEEEWESEEPYSNFEKEVLKIHKDEFSWNKIRYLNLYRENIDTLDGIDSFSSLKYLTIKSCRLEKLNGIENLEKLGLINVSDNFIKNLNNFNKNMDSVYELIISNNDKLGDIRGMKYFPNLNKLDISYCNIKDLDNLRYLKKLRILNCGNNIISDISPLYDLPDLMNINITNNLVSNLDRIGNLNKLNILNLNGNIVEFISGSSNSIRSLSLRDNRLKTLKGIDKYSSLESLDVCFNSNLTIRNIIWNTRNLKLKELYVSRSNNILSKYCKSRNIRLYTSL